MKKEASITPDALRGIRDEARADGDHLLADILELAAGEIEYLQRLLKPLAELVQRHNQHIADSAPIFGIDDKMILMGDCRKAAKARKRR